MQGRANNRAKRRIRYTDELKLRCMRLLETRRERHLGRDHVKPVTAAALGRALRYWPDVSHETLRRRVRELVVEMRDQGAPVASGPTGYWAAETVEDFAKSAAFLRRIGLAPMATSARLKQSAAAARATKQLRMPAYHALVTGRNALALYRQPGERLAAPQATPKQAGDAPANAERPGQTWPDSLFASC